MTSHLNLSKDFQRSNESHFRIKIPGPVIIDLNFEIRGNHCVPCDVFLFYHWKRCGKLITCVLGGLKDHVVKRFSPGPSFAGLFRHCRPFMASQVTLRKDIKVLYKFAQPWFTHIRFFSRLLDPQKTCSFVGPIKLCRIFTGLFWDTVDNFADFFDGFYYIFTGESTSKAERFDNLRSLKILITPLTQNWKRPGIHKKRPEQEQKPQTRKGAIRRAWRMRPFPAKHPSGYTPHSKLDVSLPRSNVFFQDWISYCLNQTSFFQGSYVNFPGSATFFFSRIGNPFFRCGCLFFPGLALAVFFFRIGCLVSGVSAFCSGIVCLFLSITSLFLRSVAFFQH